MTQTKLKMQPTIHLRGKAGYLRRPYLGLRSKCIVGCIFKSLGLIITRESPCRFFHSFRLQKMYKTSFTFNPSYQTPKMTYSLKSIATPPPYLNQLKICTLSRRLHHFYKIYIAVFFTKYYTTCFT
jgi:hypothetical protein